MTGGALGSGVAGSRAVPTLGVRVEAAQMRAFTTRVMGARPVPLERAASTSGVVLRSKVGVAFTTKRAAVVASRRGLVAEGSAFLLSALASAAIKPCRDVSACSKVRLSRL